MARALAVRAERRQADARAEATRRAAAEDAARTAQAAVAQAQLSAVARAETALLEARTAPLRSYLVQHVIPHITSGLVEVCKAAPADPVDYLAEYLLKVAAAGGSSAGAAVQQP
jgi:adenylate kinase